MKNNTFTKISAKTLIPKKVPSLLQNSPLDMARLPLLIQLYTGMRSHELFSLELEALMKMESSTFECS